MMTHSDHASPATPLSPSSGAGGEEVTLAAAVVVDAAGSAGADQHAARLIRVFCAWFFSLMLILACAVYWVWTTESGTAFAVTMLPRFAAVELQGVKGRFSDKLQVAHLRWQYGGHDVSADNVQWQWQPAALFRRRLQIDVVHIGRLQFVFPPGDGKALTLPVSLALPWPLAGGQADQLQIDSLQFSVLPAELNKDGLPVAPVQSYLFSSLKVRLSADAQGYVFALSGVSPWGHADLRGKLASAAPFSLTGQFDWQGLRMQHQDATIPATQISGNWFGQLSKLQLQARMTAHPGRNQVLFAREDMTEDALIRIQKKLQTQSPAPAQARNQNKNKESVYGDSLPEAQRKRLIPAESGGQLFAVITPLAGFPLESLKVDFHGLDPGDFYVAAPQANMHIQAELNTVRGPEGNSLQGMLALQNKSSAPWNQGGVPLTSLTTRLSWSERQFSWQSLQVLFAGQGVVQGYGRISLRDFIKPDISANVDSGKGIKLSHKNDDQALSAIAAQFDVQNLDLARVDSRMETTRLNGKMQVEQQNSMLHAMFDLREKRVNFDAKLHAKIRLSPGHIVYLDQFELMANEGCLSAAGSVDLQGNNAFLLKGDANNVDPSRWVHVPGGRIQAHFSLAGQWQPEWQLTAQLAHLSGQFAGLDLHGDADLSIRSGPVLMIKTLNLGWGGNQLVASGNWMPAGQHMPAVNSQMRIKLVLPDLAAASHPFEKIMPSSVSLPLRGAVYVDGVVSGDFQQPAGYAAVNIRNVMIPGLLTLEKLQATLTMAPGAAGAVDGMWDLQGLTIAGNETEQSVHPLRKTENAQALRPDIYIKQLQAGISGVRHDHVIRLNATFLQQYHLQLQAQGDLQKMSAVTGNVPEWAGQVQVLNLSGPLDLQLAAPVTLRCSAEKVQLAAASWRSSMGVMQLQQLHWAPGQLVTSGTLQALPVAEALKLWRADVPVEGKLLVDASWKIDMGQQLAGQIEVKRRSGDLSVLDVINNHELPIVLGLQTLLLHVNVSPDLNDKNKDKAIPAFAGSALLNAGSRQSALNVTLDAQGSQLGILKANFSSILSKAPAAWVWADTAPLSGQAGVRLPDIHWMSGLAGAGVVLHGSAQVSANIAGTVGTPLYQARVSAQQLQVALTELGVLLPDGHLELSIDNNQLRLAQLRFSRRNSAPPKHVKLNGLDWISETGTVEASGQVDLKSGQGTIAAHWQRFPFLQGTDRWLVASGDAQLTQSAQTWNLTGELAADAAYFSIPRQITPKLSGDVYVVSQHGKKSEVPPVNQSGLDFKLKMGENFVFVGRGLDTRLVGDLRLRARNDSSLQANGSIRTDGGSYEGYGQKLAIERGILNFQGMPDNPGLNVSAMRRGLAVEAGLEITGTVSRPQVRLISEPNVPDVDKLSWMVMGRGADQLAGSESGLLLSAAGAIFGGEDGKNIPRGIVRGLGFDEFSVGSSNSLPGSQLPSQTVAGGIASTAGSDQVVSVDKRITPNLVFSIERSLTDATNGLKLTWHLAKGVSIIGRAGSDTAIDGQYTFSFD